jgi:multidrug efflux pump subunit AcrA (membrane-fusion protein)
LHDHEHVDTQFLVTELDVRRGESVEAGQQIAQISDYSRLLIEGHAYQRDTNLLRRAADTRADLQAIMAYSEEQTEVIGGLKVVYIGNEVGRESRSLPFYVGLENEIERSERRDGKQYVSWRFKPGQRLTVRVPVSHIDNALVVPKDAVAEEGPERFLFVENGDHFDRVPVEELARDSVNVAIRNDGKVWPGQTIAVSGAHQLQMAMRNRAGGAIDPHAGHNH